MINKGHYQSNNYEEADYRVDIYVDAIIGKVRVERN
jgi:predicted membrane protein